jgi:adenosylcobinamide-phosphate synthase
MLRDAKKHKSPNAGWPEAAMAGALNLQLAGPQIYDGEASDGAYLGDGERNATPAHIVAALAVYMRVCGVIFIALILAALV